jgi:hypothetical protein
LRHERGLILAGLHPFQHQRFELRPERAVAEGAGDVGTLADLFLEQARFTGAEEWHLSLRAESRGN